MSAPLTPARPPVRIELPAVRVARRRPRWRPETFRALRHRNYRLYFWGQVVSLTGSWLQTAALTWLAYDLTGQSRWPALVGAAQVVPTCLLGGWGGSLADRRPKRWLIFTCQAALLALAMLLAGGLALGLASPWFLLAVAVVIGVVNAIDLPARLSFVIDMVGRDDLPNAVALNSLSFNVARATGPALAGLLLPLLGPAVCFLLNGLSFVTVLAARAAMRLPRHAGTLAARRPSTSMAQAFAYLGRRPALVLLLVLAGAMSFFVWPMLTLLPAVADVQLGRGTDGYAALLSAVGCGALVAALLVATFGSRAGRAWFLAAGVVLSAVGLVGLAGGGALPDGLAFATLAGAGMIAFFATAQAVMQLGSAEENRGRIMGIWSAVLCGAHPLGHLCAGLAADQWGTPPVLAGMALGVAAAGAAVLIARARLRKQAA
jgi:MFS family permease